MRFMVGSPALVGLWRMVSSEWRIGKESIRYSPLAIRLSNPRHIEARLHAGAVGRRRALLPHRVGALEEPVLPGGKAGKDFRFHGLRPDEAQVRFQAGEAVR